MFVRGVGPPHFITQVTQQPPPAPVILPVREPGDLLIAMASGLVLAPTGPTATNWTLIDGANSRFVYTRIAANDSDDDYLAEGNGVIGGYWVQICSIGARDSGLTPTVFQTGDIVATTGANSIQSDGIPVLSLPVGTEANDTMVLATYSKVLQFSSLAVPVASTIETPSGFSLIGSGALVFSNALQASDIRGFWAGWATQFQSNSAVSPAFTVATTPPCGTIALFPSACANNATRQIRLRLV